MRLSRHKKSLKNCYSPTWFELFLEPIQPVQTEREIDFLTCHLPNPPYKTVLDACCGQGRHANLLANMGYQVTGIDLDEAAIDKARHQSNGQVIYSKMDMRNLSELPGSFDAVLNLWQSLALSLWYFVPALTSSKKHLLTPQECKLFLRRKSCKGDKGGNYDIK